MARSATCSNALIRGIFRDYLDALKELRLSEPLAEEVAAALPLYPSLPIRSSKGTEDPRMGRRNMRRRNPITGTPPIWWACIAGKEITVDTPELAEGARRTLENARATTAPAGAWAGRFASGPGRGDSETMPFAC